MVPVSSQVVTCVNALTCRVLYTLSWGAHPFEPCLEKSSYSSSSLPPLLSIPLPPNCQVSRLFVYPAGLEWEKLSRMWLNSLQDLCDHKCTGNEHSGELLQRTCSFIEGGGREGVFMPLGKALRVFWARFVWPCTIGQSKGIGRCFIYILRGCRMCMGGNLNQGNTFLLGLILWEPVGKGEVVNSCHPHVGGIQGSLDLFSVTLGHYGPCINAWQCVSSKVCNCLQLMNLSNIRDGST